MKVVITGGTGFVGLNIARALVRRNTLTGPSGEQESIDEMVLFDAAAPEERPSGLDDRVTIESGDISDRETVFGLIDRDDIAVFHLASILSGGGERDFDLAMQVNLTGGLNVLEALREREGAPRMVFASTQAVFGGPAMPAEVRDETKQTPQTTYGVTKAILELLINDYTRKGFIDGRGARLPTIIIRPGRPNSAASSFCSGVFREPLDGAECVLPVGLDVRMPLLGYRNCVRSFIALHEADGAAIGPDRIMNLPSASYSVAEMVEAVKRAAERHGIGLGPITVSPDPVVQKIVDGWAKDAGSDRARALGLPFDESLDHVVEDYIEDFWVKR
jgi:nucleoside-diphosphate-sugar epimerase